MKLDKKSLLLYAVTDRTWVGNQTLSQQVEETLKAGTTLLQLREKDLSSEEFLEEAKIMRKICEKYKVPFMINDNVEIALACNADGVHVGQSDRMARDVRKALGADKIIGVSAQTVEQAKLAQEQGADYLGVGAVFNTSTKLDAAEVSFETLKAICRAVTIPVIAIGGISLKNISELKDTEIDGIAVVSAIFASENITEATHKLLEKVKDIVNE
ncbi:MAG: thiamine phosphate synthase [Lachnotalea sp.]